MQNPNEQRAARWQQLAGQAFDLLVVGGGASGCGVALDAALRGFRVALVEAGDFGAGTSATSTKLVHGGVRYLEKAFKELDRGQYKLVREALRERRRMLDNAPHLAHELGLLLPVFSVWQRVYYGLGVWAYDALAGGGKLKPSRWFGQKKAVNAFPLLKKQGLAGGILFYDGQFNDSLYAIALALSAENEGAVVLSHAKCTGMEPGPEFTTCHIADQETGAATSVNTRVVVNCTGHQSDYLRQLARPTASKRLRPSKGAHITVPLAEAKVPNGMLIPKTDDGRVVFVLPWLQSLLIGTTDTDVADPNAPATLTPADVDYLLEQTNRFMANPILKSQLRGGFAGLRPLVASGTQGKTEALIRDHEIEVFAHERMVNVLGGKWTTYRLMAECAVNEAASLLGKTGTHCRTHDYALNSLQDIPTGDLSAQVTYYVRLTHARTLADVLDNRLRVGMQDVQQAWALAEPVSHIMAPALGWGEHRRQEALRAYGARLKQTADALGLSL